MISCPFNIFQKNLNFQIQIIALIHSFLSEVDMNRERDLLVKWKRNGEVNKVSSNDLYYNRSSILKRGSTVHMRGKSGWWKGEVMEILEDEDEDEDDIPLPSLGM